MTKAFTVNLHDDPQVIFLKFKQTAAKNGIKLQGDSREGRFSGKGITGYYDMSGDKVNITIEEKPFLIGWSLIESKIRDFFA